MSPLGPPGWLAPPRSRAAAYHRTGPCGRPPPMVETSTAPESPAAAKPLVTATVPLVTATVRTLPASAAAPPRRNADAAAAAVIRRLEVRRAGADRHGAARAEPCRGRLRGAAGLHFWGRRGRSRRRRPWPRCRRSHQSRSRPSPGTGCPTCSWTRLWRPARRRSAEMPRGERPIGCARRPRPANTAPPGSSVTLPPSPVYELVRQVCTSTPPPSSPVPTCSVNAAPATA